MLRSILDLEALIPRFKTFQETALWPPDERMAGVPVYMVYVFKLVS